MNKLILFLPFNGRSSRSLSKLALWCAILSLAFAPVLPQAQQQANPGRAKVLITFSSPVNADDVRLVQTFGGEVDHVFSIVNGVAATVPNTKEFADTLLLDRRVVRVERDGTIQALDAELDNAWGVKRIGAGNVHAAGNKGTGVRVAIIDSGVDGSHPDLDANFAGGYDFVNDDNDPMDDNGHGTHVAGTVGAEDNDSGVVGVAPEVEIYGLKVLSSSGSGSWSDVIAALNWIVDFNNNNDPDIRVTNNSYGAGSDPGQLVQDAFQNAYNAGVLHIAAAGNSGNPPGKGDKVGYPARYSSVVAVAATDQNDNRASFSSTGPDVEIAAPGVSILSTVPNGGYDSFSGTSMASPHVAGTAALIFAAGISSNDDACQILRDTADDLGPSGKDDHFGYGLVDADGAVDAVPSGAPTVAWVNPTSGDTVSGTSVLIRIEASDTENGAGTLNVQWRVDGNESWSSATYDTTSGYYEASWDSTSVLDGNHTLEARATDIDTNTSSSSITVSTDNTDDPPTVAWVNPQEGDTVGGTVTIQIDASDPEDSTGGLNVEWSVDGGSNWQPAGFNNTSGYYEDTWETSGLADGSNHTLTSRATDSSGNSSGESSISVTVDNTASSDAMGVYDISWKLPGPHLEFTVNIREDSDASGTLTSNDNPVGSAAVSGTLTNNDTNESWNFSSSTGSGGDVSFKLQFAPAGTYTAEVTGLTHSTFTWDPTLDVDNPDTFTK